MKTEIRHFHLFCGLGGGARGFNRGEARVGSMEAAFRCIGGVDSDPAAIRDFTRAADAQGTVLDMFDRDQYRAWHGHEPPADWREATPADLRLAAGGERPHIIFTSPPCKGFSGLLNSAKAGSAKYEALNRLTVRGVLLACEAWADDPPEFFLLENVPRIATRGAPLLDRIEAVLHHYGYAVARTTHDCGELGGLAQTRKRFLLVARHQAKVPAFLYEPVKRPLRAVGDVLGRMPLPGHPIAGPMHSLPNLQWRTWVRLAFVEAGKDWRSLERLRVVDGMLADYGIVPESVMHNTVLGVVPWAEPMGTVAGSSWPLNGSYSVADPRCDWSPSAHRNKFRIVGWDRPGGTVTGSQRCSSGALAVSDPRFAQSEHWKDGQQLGVHGWDDTAGTITGQRSPAQGKFAVADPRPPAEGRFNNVYRVVPFDTPSPAVTAGTGPTAGGLAVADPRVNKRHEEKPTPGERQVKTYRQFGVQPWDEPSLVVTGSCNPSSGPYTIADPRLAMRSDREHFKNGGHFGVAPWADPARTVTGALQHDNGFGNVADPRLPEAREQGVFVIQALDGTWHRPFTTLELAALQGLVDPDEYLELEGKSDSAHRERIGNAVPPPAGQAIASVMGKTLLLAWSGETLSILNSDPLWVRPIVLAVAAGR